MCRVTLVYPGMRAIYQSRLLLLSNWRDLKIGMLARLAITFGVLVSFSMPVASFAGSNEAIKAYDSGEYQKALEMWMLLAYEGDAEAQYRLGTMFLHGTGIGVSTDEAVYWLSRAAEQGESNAQYLLGAIYLSGKGLRSDREHGLEWWQAAANNGHSAAQYGIGIAHLYGAGVSANSVDARKWLMAALKSGSPEAGRVLQNLDELSDSKSRIDSVVQYARVGPVPVWIYSAFNRLSMILTETKAGELVKIIERQDDWYQVELNQSLSGWVHLNDIEQVSGQDVKVAEGTVLRSRRDYSQNTDSVLMELNKNHFLLFIDLSEPWVKLSVSRPLTGWTPVLGLVEQANSPTSLEQIWRDEYQSESRKRHGAEDVAVLSEILQVQDNIEMKSGTETATKLEMVSSINEGTGQAKEGSTASESTGSALLKRNDYEWLLAQEPQRYTLELFSSTSEVLMRQFYRAEQYEDYVSYFSSSVSDKRWFTLFHGSYSDLDGVQKALSLLPVRLDTIRVRRISSVVRDLCSSLDDVPAGVVKILNMRCLGNM